MSSALGPRVVLITRETDYEALLARHATQGQARFFLRSRHQTIDETEARHLAMQAAITELRAGIPREWRIAQVKRADLDRFLFAPEDVVVAVGQDGLVANVAKYLSGQPVIGVNPEPARNPGILVPHDVASAIRLLAPAAAGQVATEDRTMLRAVLDTGQALLALNEVFIGHASHQSARYVIAHDGREEAQSSSGLIVASGTGATGWALSIGQATGYPLDLAPGDRGAVFLVREPWPSQATGVSVTHGRLGAADTLQIVSRMNEHGVVFADGMEQDRLPFGWGAALSVQVAEQRLRLVPSERSRAAVVRPAPPPPPAPVVQPSPPPAPKPRPVRRPRPASSYAPLLWLVMVMTGVVGAGAAMLLAEAVADFGSLQPVVFWPDGLNTLGLLALPLTFAWHRFRRRSLTALRFVIVVVVLAGGLDASANGWLTVLSINGDYKRCAALDRPPVEAYARPGACQ